MSLQTQKKALYGTTLANYMLEDGKMANLAKEKRFVKVFNMIRMAIALKDSLEMGKEVVMELYYRVMAIYIRRRMVGYIEDNLPWI